VPDVDNSTGSHSRKKSVHRQALRQEEYLAVAGSRLLGSRRGTLLDVLDRPFVHGFVSYGAMTVQLAPSSVFLKSDAAGAPELRGRHQDKQQRCGDEKTQRDGPFEENRGVAI